jgi:hypothetical protein
MPLGSTVTFRQTSEGVEIQFARHKLVGVVLLGEELDKIPNDGAAHDDTRANREIVVRPTL